jgi:phosphopentomutase
MNRFIVIVLDGFGIGAMEDARDTRPADVNANTLKSILTVYPDLKLPTLQKLGLMNAAGFESRFMHFDPTANYRQIFLDARWRRYVHGTSRDLGYLS